MFGAGAAVMVAPLIKILPIEAATVTPITEGIAAGYIASYTRFSKQMLSNLPFLTDYIHKNVMNDYFKAENKAIFGS